jgi:thiamine pyrophosphate-dependent acetolactate synthase large subunit-like protein
LAQAFGADGLRAQTPLELAAALAAGLPKAGPVLIDCLVSPDEYAMPVAMQPGTGSEMRLA